MNRKDKPKNMSMKKIMPVTMSAIAVAAAAATIFTACDKKGESAMTDTNTSAESIVGDEPLTGIDAYAGNNVNYLCGIDTYGRVFEPISGWDDSKDVGMFYFLWHGDSGKNTYDVTKLLETGDESLWDPSINTNEFHYWGEPLYGYYNSWDKWVISRHIEMFIAAGIDYLAFDVTNGPTYVSAYTAVCDVLTEYQKNGWDVPKIAFYTNSNSMTVMYNLYNDLYSKGSYKDLWYCPSGEKPLIIGEVDESNWTEDSSFIEFFDIRQSQWPNSAYRFNGIPWMDWNYPQKTHDGFMNVSVAQHPQLPFSNSIIDRTLNRGRGYDFETGINVEEDSRKGINFQSQWNTVLDKSDKVDNVFVTGWNEWIAQKLVIDGKVWFVDCANEEFSRDIEPMKGGYEDSFYLQLCDNVRRFKGKSEEIMKADSASIDIDGDISQWDSIRNVYSAITQTDVSRYDSSVDGQTKYVQKAARNNIQSVKMTNDRDNLYFLISCKGRVKDADSSDFMNLYLGIGDIELVGWEGYEYVVSCGDKAVYALDAEGAKTKIADVSVSADGQYVQACIPLSTIGASEAEGVYFKLCDEISSTDIMDTYTEGKCLPMGRLSYYYYFG